MENLLGDKRRGVTSVEESLGEVLGGEIRVTANMQPRDGQGKEEKTLDG